MEPQRGSRSPGQGVKLPKAENFLVLVHPSSGQINPLLSMWTKTFTFVLIHCALSLAAQCIVIGPVCLWVCLFVRGSVNSKLHASIFTKLSL